MLQPEGDTLRLPCFHLTRAVGVLPAFGSFTGGGQVVRQPGDRVFVVADDRVVEAPRALTSGRVRR